MIFPIKYDFNYTGLLNSASKLQVVFAENLRSFIVNSFIHIIFFTFISFVILGLVVAGEIRPKK